MKWLAALGERIGAILTSGQGEHLRPALSRTRESNIRGLYVIGDLAGAPVIKLAMAQGYETVETIASLPDARGDTPGVYDLVIVGAGAAGLNAALQARERGLRAIVLEKEKIANTIENFPEGKWVYAEPDEVPPKGKLWLDGAQKEDLIRRWHRIVTENELDVHTNEPLEKLDKGRDGIFTLTTPKGTYRARRVILATGQRGNPRKLGVPGEEREKVYHKLYAPRLYREERILVVGGGNSAVEAAITLSEQNRVTLSYRKDAFGRIFKENERKLEEAVQAGRIELLLRSRVVAFHEDHVELQVAGETQNVTRPYDHAFVLIGADLPVRFLRSLGIRMENEWTGRPLRATFLTLGTLFALWIAGGKASFPLLAALPSWLGIAACLLLLGTLIYAAVGRAGSPGDRYARLGIAFLICYTIYGVKVGKGSEFWPYRGWGYAALSLFERPWSFWYSVLYTFVMTLFGIQAMKRWGFDRKDRFQIWRYVTLLSVQWSVGLLIPEFLFKWAVAYRWVGEALATNPQFAEQAWRSYGIVYAWPLFFYTFFYDPHIIWVVWGIFLSFVLIPIFVLFHGKRYCSWICGCGGLAETLGDRWRHLAPKGERAIGWEWMNLVILVLAVVVTLAMLLKDSVLFLRTPAEKGIAFYRIVADVWLVGILPVTLYPFLGGKIWCRYWCPLAKMMGMLSALYTRLGIGRFKITANDKCIGCYECSRYCQVGIDVMRYALKQETLDNSTSSCIGCGVCVSVCPMDTLRFGDPEEQGKSA